MTEAVIVGYARTPVGRFGGGLATLTAMDLGGAAIAAALAISPRTVEVHKTRIMEKLGVRNIAELVRFAVAASARSENGANGA